MWLERSGSDGAADDSAEKPLGRSGNGNDLLATLDGFRGFSHPRSIIKVEMGEQNRIEYFIIIKTTVSDNISIR